MFKETCAFLGSTLSQREAQGRFPRIKIFPPAEKGDILKCLKLGFGKILIIDGSFGSKPSVWHKEILLALEKGVSVVGAASIGAIRAVELDTFGMFGSGDVYSFYKSNDYMDDDEVAVAYSEKNGLISATLPLINFRLSIGGCEQSEKILSKLKRIQYTDRTWGSIRKETTPEEFDFLKKRYFDYKYHDAIDCLLHADSIGDAASYVPVRVPKTYYLKELIAEKLYADEIVAVSEQLKLLASEVDSFGLSEVEKKRAYELSLLLNQDGQGWSSWAVGKLVELDLDINTTALRRMINNLRINMGLMSGFSFEGWCRTRSLSEEHLLETFRDYFLIKKFLKVSIPVQNTL